MAAVAYFVIPPHNSFVIGTLPDAAHFAVFVIVALIVLAVMAMQAGLSVVDRERRDARLKRNMPVQTFKAEGVSADYLRAEAHHLTQLARTCSDRRAPRLQLEAHQHGADGEGRRTGPAAVGPPTYRRLIFRPALAIRLCTRPQFALPRCA